MLKDIGFKNKGSKSHKFFDKYCWDFYEQRLEPNEYVCCCVDKYKSLNDSKNNSLNGSIFEIIISTLCIKNNIKPIFCQAKMAFVPNVKYDIILYTQEQYPISLSLKTSLRERYKQADLEAVALKYVHRKAKCYLVSLDENEVREVKNKIENGSVLGLDAAICATSDEFNNFIADLRAKKYIKPEKIEIITAGNVINK